MGALLLAHAALILAGWVDLPLWVAVIQCLVASLVGIRQMRRFTALAERHTSGSAVPAAAVPTSVPASAPAPSPARPTPDTWSSAPVAFPARIAASREQPDGPAAEA